MAVSDKYFNATAGRTDPYATDADDNRLMVFTGNANVELAEQIADRLKLSLGKLVVGRFQRRRGLWSEIIDLGARQGRVHRSAHL